MLEQQVELLTIQLHWASEREKNLKKNYNTMLEALKKKKESSEEGNREEEEFELAESNKKKMKPSEEDKKIEELELQLE